MKNADTNLSELTDQAYAGEVLGPDYISPNQVGSRTNGWWWEYTAEQMRYFNHTFPDRSTIDWFSQNGFVLMAGPPREFSVLDLLDFGKKLSVSAEKRPFLEELSRNTDKIAVGKWLAISKGAARFTLAKPWEEQQQTILYPQEVPNITEVTYAVLTYQKVNKGSLATGGPGRTSTHLQPELLVYMGSAVSQDGIISTVDTIMAHPNIGAWSIFR